MPSRVLILIICLLLSAVLMAAPETPVTTQIQIQSAFPALLGDDTPPGGAHPVGGPANHFVQLANPVLRPVGLRLVLHGPEGQPPSDRRQLKPALPAAADFATLYEAVAAGSADGGIDAAIDITINSGRPYGELLVAGLPFGLNPAGYAAWLYDGGGLALQQQLYDEDFDEGLKVIPIAITPAQGGGWFPAALPDAAMDGDGAEQALADLCQRPWIVRWPEPAGAIWRRACDDVGVDTQFIGSQTRCVNSTAACPSPDNPVRPGLVIDRLTFGGFAPGVSPHQLLATGNIDAFELNLPTADVTFFGRVSEASGRPVSQLIDLAPFLYAGAWQQPASYIELIVHKPLWRRLNQRQQQALISAARAATLANWSGRQALQGEALERLQTEGAELLRWPPALLDLLREATAPALDDKADGLAMEGEDGYRRVLQAQRAFIAGQRPYRQFDAPIGEGEQLPTSPAQ